MTDLTIGGETFNVLIEGDDTLPVLMLSNSLGSDLHLWDAQMPDLLQHFRIIRYDSRGHGGSVVNAGPYSIAMLGRDALAILDALGIDKVHWMGISKGGAIGQWLMIHAPERIERAVLANTAAQFGPPEGWNARIVTVRQAGMGALVESIMARWFNDAFVATHAEQVEPVRATLRATPPEGYAACCSALRDLDLREGLAKIEHPVLVIAGRGDLSVSTAQTDLVAASIAGARLVTLDTRHISNVEDSAGFTKAVVEFLTARSQGRRAPREGSLPRAAVRRSTGRRLAAARGAATEALARRTPLTAPAAVKSKAAPTKAARTAAKAVPASKPTGKSQATAKTSTRKASAKASAPKPSAKRTPLPKAVPTKVKAAKVKAAKPRVAKPAVAKTAPARGKAAPAKIVATATPATPAKRRIVKAATAPTGKAKRSPIAAKAPAKRVTPIKAKATAKAPVRTVVKTKSAAKAAGKAAPATKASAAKTKTRKIVSAPARRKPAAKAPGRPAGRRKA